MTAELYGRNQERIVLEAESSGNKDDGNERDKMLQLSNHERLH